MLHSIYMYYSNYQNIRLDKLHYMYLYNHYYHNSAYNKPYKIPYMYHGMYRYNYQNILGNYLLMMVHSIQHLE